MIQSAMEMADRELRDSGPIDGIFSAHGMVLRPNEDIILAIFINKKQDGKNAAFLDVIEDCSHRGTKILTDDYLKSGLYPIVDKGQDFICGFRNDSNGIF